MKKIIPIASVLLMITSCGDPGESNVVVKEERIPIKLTDEDLYKGNKILAFLQNEQKFLKEANTLFLNGINSYRNKADLDSAEHYLRMSILKEPTGRAYFELGNVNLDKKNFDEALMAYGIAEQLDYQPLSKIMYNRSCLYSLKGEEELAGKYLEYAIQSGYNNLDHIGKDEDLAALRETGYYDRAIEKGLRGVSNAENLYWLEFKKQFATVKMPIKLKTELSQAEMEELKYISFDYERYISEMRDEKFSREVSKAFYHYAQPYETEGYVAIVYVVKDEYMGDYAPLTYRLATFTHEGKLIDKRQIGGRELLSEPMMEATLKKDMTISIDLLEPQYKEDPEEVGYYDNPMLSSKKVGTMKMRINEKGKIIIESKKDIIAAN